jgi:hypothetical protein
MALLEKQGFTVIENCFANYDYTLASISSIYLMKHHYYLAETGDRSGTRGMLFRTMSGENPVIYTLKANGYQVNYIDFGGWFFTLFQRGPNIDLLLSHLDRGPFHLLPSLFSDFFDGMVLFVIRELFHLNAETEDDTPQGLTSTQPGVVEFLSQKKDSPNCTIFYMGADHVGHVIVPSSVERSGENKYDYFAHKAYPNIRRCADEDLIMMLRMIQGHDPEALIILIGDHAAHRYYEANFMSGDANAILHSRGLEPSLVGRDHVGVLCAIRWPRDMMHYSAGRVISHVNLFRHVFAALAEDPAVLARDYQPDESYVPAVSANGIRDTTRLYCVARDGRLLDDWEVFTPPPLE